MKIMGETTPSVVFSATVSTAALITPSLSSAAVSRPTYIATALRPASSDSSSAEYTCTPASARLLRANSVQHSSASMPNPSQKFTPRSQRSRKNGTAKLTPHTMIHRNTPAAVSPRGVLGKIRRSSFSESDTSLPTAQIGCGSFWGSPKIQSSKKPSSTAQVTYMAFLL